MSNLAVREKRQPSLMTKELHRRANLGLMDKARVNPVAPAIFVSFIATLFFVLVEIFTTTTVAFTAPGIVISSLAMIASGIWGINMVDSGTGTMGTGDREDQLRWGQALAHRAHRDLELTRIKEVRDYDRYTPYVRREGTNLKFEVIAGAPRKGKSLLKWDAKTKRVSVDISGSFNDYQIAGSVLTNPTVEKAMVVLDQVQETAEALEQKSYEEALERHRLDVISLVVNPPIASFKSQANVMRDDWQVELRELDA